MAASKRKPQFIDKVTGAVHGAPESSGTPNEERKIIREYIEGESPREIERGGRERKNTDSPLSKRPTNRPRRKAA